MSTSHIPIKKFFTLVPALLLVIFLATFVQPAAAEEDFPQSNVWYRNQPSVVWCNDPTSTTTLEVHIVGRSDVKRVWITDLNGYGPEGELEFFDDGSHGDVTAGDRVFTLSEVVLPCAEGALLRKGGYGTWWGFLRVELSNGTLTGNNYGMTIGMVAKKFKGVFSVKDLGNGLSASAYAFFIQDSNHKVMNDYPLADVTCGTTNMAAYQKLYSVLPDDFDFAMVMPGMQIFRPNGFAENVPYNILVANAVKYIGIPLIDNTAGYGSAGRLKSTIYHSFGGIDIFDHEVAHTWGATIGQSLGILKESGSEWHWNEMTDINGQLGYYYFDQSGKVGHFAYNGDETWRLIANTEVEPYSPLELYVMGLIPPEQVPDIHILQSPDLSDFQNITAASYRTITINDIIQAEGGVREPDSTSSQKDFNLAFIVTQDLPYNDAAYAYFSLMSYQLMSSEAPESCCLAPFNWATGGLATLNSRLPVDLPEPEINTALGLSPTSTPESNETAASPTETSQAETTAASSTGSSSPLCKGAFLAIGLTLLPLAWVGFARLRKQKE